MSPLWRRVLLTASAVGGGISLHLIMVRAAEIVKLKAEKSRPRQTGDEEEEL